MQTRQQALYMNAYKVRYLQSDDTEYWLEMWQEYMAFYQTTLPSEVAHHTLQRLLADDTQMGCIIACDPQNIPIGFLNYVIHPSTWEIAPVCYAQDLYIKPLHRQSGVAKLFLEQIKTVSLEQQCSQIYWITKPDNFVAQAFYNKIAKGEPWIVYVMQPKSIVD